MPVLYGWNFEVIVIESSVRPWNAALERDHPGPAGVQARELDRVLDRLRARVEERRARLTADRRQRAEALGELDVGLVGDDRVVRVQEQGGLLRHRVDDRRVGVPGVDHADSAREVDEDVAVDVGDGRVVGPSREDRQVHEQRLGDRA